MNAFDNSFLHSSKIDLMLTECADRENCKIFYGVNTILQPWACYHFEDDEAFNKAHHLLRCLGPLPYFECMESLSRTGDTPGGVIYTRRPRGRSLYKVLGKKDRTEQLQICIALAKGLRELHRLDQFHGALDEDNVVLDAVYGIPVIQEMIAEFSNESLRSPFCPPEQDRVGEGWATDVFQFGAGYLGQISAPSPNLKRLIEQCLDPDPNKRPKAKKLVSQLEIILAAETMEQIWPRVRVPWRWIMSGAVGVSLVLLGAVLLYRRGYTQTPAKVYLTQDGEKVVVSPQENTRSFEAFASGLSLLTGKSVTYPSHLATKNVMRGSEDDPWEEVLKDMGLQWEINIVNAAPAKLQEKP